MMELDELKTIWGKYYQQAEQRVSLNKDLLISTSLSKIKSHVGQFRATSVFELIINGLFIIYLMGFVIDHWRETEFFVPGIVLILMVGTHFSWNIYSLKQMRSLHYGLSITEIQKKIHTLHLYQRYQIRSLYVAIPLFAVCFAVLLPKALFGISIYPYLNIHWYYQLLGTIALTPVVVWFVNKFPDQGMMEAERFFADIVKFEETE